MSSSGATRRVISPTLSAAERDARESQERKAQAERERQRNLVRRDQALLMRYPNQQAHDDARAEALVQPQTMTQAAEKRMADLTEQRAALQAEMEFYVKDPSKAPPRLRRALQDNDREQEMQRRSLANQQEEIKRLNARFDEEAARLQPMWQAARQGEGAAPPNTANRR